MESPTFHLEGIIRTKEEMQDFEGPLTLILMLLSKNKIEIRDVKIADILDQYLSWLDRMQKMDLEVASEFVQMASHLVYIKTKTLLAGTEEVSELELLLSSLEQLKCRDTFAALKSVLPTMAEQLEAGALLLSRPQEPMPRYGIYNYRHRPWELMAALSAVLQKGIPQAEETASVPVPRPIVYSVREKGSELINLLRARGKTRLRVLYAMATSRSELVATFLSLLTMCSAGSVTVERNGDDYTVQFIGGDEDAVLGSLDYA